VPDLARLTLDLLEWSNKLLAFETVHYRGDVVDPARKFFDMVAQRAGHPGLGVQRMPWLLLRAASLVDPVLRELMELRYLFDSAVIIDDPRRRALLPDFSGTPLQTAIAETLASYRP